MKKAIFPGTFDPPTLGHLNIITRASRLVDELDVVIGCNSQKSHFLFSTKERAHLLHKITHSLPNVKIVIFDGLLVDYAKQSGAICLIRSLRNFSDFEYEMMHAYMNKQLGEIETLYLAADERYCHVSSTLIREVAQYGRRLDAFVSSEIEAAVFERLLEHQQISIKNS
jgi:pantetheine-phosphate adenylyltransferase